MSAKRTNPDYEPTWEDSGPSDEQVNTAMRVLRAEYWTSVRSMARDIIARIASGEVDRNEISDAVHEDCDSCYWTIYTAASQRAVLCSDHDWSETAEDMGYFCLLHDVGEQVEAELPDEDESEAP